MALTTAVAAQEPGAEHIGGRVVDARTGAALARAQVSLTDLATEKPVAVTTADEEGHFLFPVTPRAGKYRLVGAAPGYLPTSYLHHGDFATAIVTGAGLPVSSLLLAVEPEAAIFGKLTDESSEPVPHATVFLYRRSLDTGVEAVHVYRSDTVEGDSFRFEDLPAGEYFLAARGTPWYAVHAQPQESAAAYDNAVDASLNVAYPTIFYPQVLDSREAAPLVLAAGEEREANLQFVTQPAVTLTLQGGTNSPKDAVPVQLTETVFGEEMPVATEVQITGGTQRITGMAPGRYRLHRFLENGDRQAGSGTVDLTGGSAVREMGAMSPEAQVTLRLRNANKAPLPAQVMVTLFTQSANANVSAPMGKNGEANFRGVAPGTYSVRVTSGDGELAVAGLQGRPDVVNGSHLVFSSGPVQAGVVVSGPPVTVQGVVREGGKPVPAAMVLLLPAQQTVEPEDFRRDQSDLDGSFSLAQVAPGDYLLLALTGAWTKPWADLRRLTPYLLHAQPLRIPAVTPSTVRVSTPVTPQIFP